MTKKDQFIDWLCDEPVAFPYNLSDSPVVEMPMCAYCGKSYDGITNHTHFNE